jgi:type IV secretion system protein VirB6
MNCFASSMDGPSGVSDVLSSVDCATGQVTRIAFERIFGIHGTLSFALTAILSIYVALLAITLLTGRSTMRLSLLTPRALTIGLVLTFATSWVAYQQVVWNLAAGAPDQIAGILLGSHGSAVHLFANQLDKLFAAITDAAKAASAATTDLARKNAPFAPSDLLWFSAMLLLLGTAGVLIVARVALAAMLAIGPLFIVLALFEGVRGLFEGWLRAVILFAVIPLLTVLVGSGALLLLDPMVQSLTLSSDTPSMQMALGIFMGACVYAALMLMTIKAAAVLASALRLPKGNVGLIRERTAAAQPADLWASPPPTGSASQDERIRELVTATQSSFSTSLFHVVERSRGRGAIPFSLSTGDRASSQERLRGLGATRLKKEFGE